MWTIYCLKQKITEDQKDNDKCPVQCLKLNFCKSEYMNVYNVEHFSPPRHHGA